jgi:hypothetical protein
LLRNTEIDDRCRMTLVIPARGQAFEGRFQRGSCLLEKQWIPAWPSKLRPSGSFSRE